MEIDILVPILIIILTLVVLFIIVNIDFFNENKYYIITICDKKLEKYRYYRFIIESDGDKYGEKLCKILKYSNGVIYCISSCLDKIEIEIGDIVDIQDHY